jgi:glycosyltransferase involved in cell wall biosynthesis
MRIAMVTGSYPPQPCGVGDYTNRLVHELEAAGVEIEVVTTRTADRVATDTVRYVLRKWTLKNWWGALRWMRTRSFDVIHIQYPARFYGYRPFLGLLTIVTKIVMPGVPVVITLHEFRITHILRKLTAVGLAAPASAVVLTADSERTEIEKWMPWLRPRLHVLTMASTIPPVEMNDERRREVRRSHGIADTDLVIVYFGLLHPNKGIEAILKSFAIVHRQMPHTRLMMLSLFDPSANPYHAKLLVETSSLEIQDAIVWAGYLDNTAVSEHLSSADIGFFPYQDGVTLRRLSFMTGMSHGLPTLTTTGHAGWEKIGLRNGENVLLVDAGAHTEEMARSLQTLASDPRLRVRLSQGARAWAAPFQWSTIVARSLDLYAELTGKRGEFEHLNR